VILIAGASGLLGGRIARLLLARGQPVRAATRNPASLEPLRALGAEVVQADLLDPASLARACTGARQVITTANSFLGTGASSPLRVDAPGNRNLFAAARTAGVEHVVFTSALGVERLAVVDYFAAKRQSEADVRGSGVAWTILRPASFMEIWGELLGKPVLETGLARIFGPGTARANYVAVSDVAAMAALALERPDARGEIIEFGGPDNLSALEVVAIFERLAGRPAKRRHVPLAVMRAMTRVLPLVNPVFARQVKLGLLSATADASFDMRPVLGRFPIPQTTFEDWARDRYT